MSVNLVVQYKEQPDNIHSEFVEIMEYFDGMINANGVCSVRFYWYGIPKENASLRKIIRRLAADGVKFKVLPRGYGNYLKY